MSRLMMRWGLPALVVLVPLALVGIPVLAQDPGQRQQQAGKQPAPNSVERAREMAALIQQGQLNLRDAATMAEKHCKGTALDVNCDIQTAQPQPKPAEPERPRGPSAQKEQKEQKEQPAGNRLVYEVSCFAKDKLMMVRIDGAAKTVIDVVERK